MAHAPVFVLVHSPLVGPGSWRPAAHELERRGRQAIVPSLLRRGGAAPRDWRECVAAVRDVTRTLSDPLVLVGHSGGGLLLPVIADAVSQPLSALIFVDSALPAGVGETPYVPPPLLDELRPLAVDGILPPWSSWFGEDVIDELVPDRALRQTLVQEMPRLPFAFLEQRIPSQPGWDRTACGYVLLSDPYTGAAAEAKERGWPVAKIEGAQHLHAAVAPPPS